MNYAGLPSRSNIRATDERLTLNKQTPSNPFTPTEEPDWVVAGNSPPRKVSTSLTTTQQRLDGPSDTSSRMLPPAFDETRRHPPRSHRVPTRVQAPATEPRSRAASQTSSADSSIARKPAPPIPKKPALLTRPSDSGVSLQNKAAAVEKTAMSRSPPAGPKSPSNNPNPRSPPPQRRMTGSMAIGAYGIQQRPSIPSSTQQSGKFDGPPLPPRRDDTGMVSPNGLMDEDNEGASAIPSLQPTRRN